VFRQIFFSVKNLRGDKKIRGDFMLKNTVALAAALSIGFASTSSAFDNGPSRYWGKNSGVAAIAYFKMPFSGADTREQTNFGLALTAPLGPKSSSFRLRTDQPRLVDLRFDALGLTAFRFNERSLLSRQSGGGSNARYAVETDTWEFVGLAVGAGLVAAVVAVGDQDSKRQCDGVPIPDGQTCNGVLTTG
jgi:hypothetical protein